MSKVLLPDKETLFLPNRVDMVRAQKETLYTAATRISTTEAVEASLVITIPAYWNSYDIFVWVSYSIFEDLSASGNDTVILRIRETDKDGDEWGKVLLEMGTVTPDIQEGNAFNGFAEAETTTGAVTVTLTAKTNVEDLRYALDDISMLVQAWQIT